MQDHQLEYPNLYLAVHVVGDWDVPDDEARFARMFSRAGCHKAKSLEKADLVVFGGGSDVEPSLYGEDNDKRHPTVYFNRKRDDADMAVYMKCRELGIPMFGVCRGAQFLHVMNGGKLYQDIDGHNGSHKCFAHKEKLTIENVSSVHHQSCKLNKDGGMEILLTTGSTASVRWINKDEKDLRPTLDIEGFYYRDTGCFGVQGHPEYQGCNKFTLWCLETIDRIFLGSEDFFWDGPNRRMTQEARNAGAMRDQLLVEDYIENTYNPAKEA